MFPVIRFFPRVIRKNNDYVHLTLKILPLVNDNMKHFKKRFMLVKVWWKVKGTEVF